MKKLQLFFIAIMASGFFFGQQYTKIPIDSNYFWKQASTCGYQYQIRYYKDTVISGNTYNKYSLFAGTSGTLPCSQSFIKNGFLRQDTLAKKVCILDANFAERPLYNFNKTSGDTLLIYDRSTNTNITYTVQSINAGTQTLLDNMGMSQFIFEGIGSHEGGLYASRQSYIPPQKTEKLICAGRINPFQITSPPDVGFESQCFLSTGLNNYEVAEPAVRYFPNPFYDVLNFQIESPRSGAIRVSIINSLGQLIMTTENYGQLQQFNLSYLAPGIYFLSVQDKQTHKVFKVQKARS
ncbi:MAG: T9SS type A sorting domain-containing protein [Bacteroidota bacterium]